MARGRNGGSESSSARGSNASGFHNSFENNSQPSSNHTIQHGPFEDRQHDRLHRKRRHKLDHQDKMEILASYMPAPVVSNGTYTHTANETSVCSHLEQLPGNAYRMGQMGQPITHLNLTIVGGKEEGNECCLVLTVIGMVLIFPFAFMFCGWWRKITLPKYEITKVTYQTISKVLASVPSLNALTLNVVDNAFNKEKAQMLYTALSSRRLAGFTFKNMALDFDWKEDEYSDFGQNMRSVAGLGIPGSILWDKKTVKA